MEIINNSIEFSDDDLYDLDVVLSEIITKSVTKFKSKVNAIPPEFFNDLLNITPEDEVIAMKKWHDTLDEIIFAFSNIDLDDMEESPYELDHSFNDKGNKFSTLKLKDGVTQEQADHINKVSDDKRKLLKTRILNGRLLFAKHFEHLWV